MTQDELARKVGYTSRTTIQKIEKGYNNLRQTKISELAKALETTPAYIMGWETEGNLNDYVVNLDTSDPRYELIIEILSKPKEYAERLKAIYDMMRGDEK